MVRCILAPCRELAVLREVTDDFEQCVVESWVSAVAVGR